MRIEIRGNAVLVTFDTCAERFDSNYERNKFFRELHGWKQVVKKYSYRREGMLDKVPHIKVSESVFIVPDKNRNDVEDFFDQWADKVECEMMSIFLREKQATEDRMERFFNTNHANRVSDIRRTREQGD